MHKKWFSIPYLFWVIVFTIIPLVLVGVYAFTASYNGTLQISFENIKEVFNPLYLRIIGYSFWVAFITTVLCLILGYPASYILSGNTFKHKNTLIFLLLVPMWMNFLLRTYSWLTLLENNGIINSFLVFLNLPKMQLLYTDTAVYLGMVYNFLPFMILPIHSVLSKIDKKLIEASEDLGASKSEIFRKVIFPLSLPGVFSGVIMVFMPAVTTFVITRLLGGGKKEMIGNVIEQQFIIAGNWGLGAAFSLLLLAIILGCMCFLNKRGLEKSGGGLI